LGSWSWFAGSNGGVGEVVSQDDWGLSVSWAVWELNPSFTHLGIKLKDSLIDNWEHSTNDIDCWKVSGAGVMEINVSHWDRSRVHIINIGISWLEGVVGESLVGGHRLVVSELHCWVGSLVSEGGSSKLILSGVVPSLSSTSIIGCLVGTIGHKSTWCTSDVTEWTNSTVSVINVVVLELLNLMLMIWD